jgi:hypothetical protein
MTQFLAQFDWTILCAAAALTSLLIAVALSDGCFEEDPDAADEGLSLFQRWLTEVEVLAGRDLRDEETFAGWDAWLRKQTPNQFAEGLK